MKESIGNAFLMTLAIVFSFLIMMIIIGTIAYTKAFKAKNKIVGIIEKYNGYEEDGDAEKDIYEDLRKMGYTVNTDSTRKCKEIEDMRIVHDIRPGRFDYCIYEKVTTRGPYYHIIVYVHFDIPAIGQYLTLQVKGDSQIIYWNFDGERWYEN
ncbi:MAG: hypothetical protein IJ565_03700 [Bacilli bacterium]|nr:hypothetical protein [Bacilli bacterium]